MTLKKVLSISRPRFWLYEGATFALIGVLAGTTGTAFIQNPLFWLWSFYFLIPANILIYGINDMCDYETDKLNPKKQSYETLVVPTMHPALWKWIAFTTIPFLFFLPYEKPALISFGIFIFCAVFYSLPPIRAKARPFLDALFSAGHYVATGVFGYYIGGGDGIPYIGILAGMLWATAMHAYSAVPDIDADTKAGVPTIATFLGKKITLLLCALLYAGSALILGSQMPFVALTGGIVFLTLMYLSYKTNTDDELFTLYTYFPLINTGIGALVSITLIYSIIMK